MSDEHPPRAPFDEQAALEDLERLRRELEHIRQRRRQANDAFDAFLRSFDRRSPAAHESTPDPTPSSRISERRTAATQDTGNASVREPSVPDTPPDRDVPAFRQDVDRSPVDLFPVEQRPEAKGEPGFATDQGLSEKSVLDPRGGELAGVEPRSSERSPDESPIGRPARGGPSEQRLNERPFVPAALRSLATRSRLRRGVVGLGAVALVGAVVFTWRARSPDGTSAPPSDRISGSVAGGRATPASPSPPQGAATVEETRVPAAELVTLRRVWVRVLVDGERAIERELEADARIPLRAKQLIVIRAGDAGAVRVSLAGEDQGVLGPDGVVATRTFVVKAAPPR